MEEQSVTVGDSTLEATLANGQVRIHLPFAVDPQRLSRQLLREGFPLAHQPETTDTQGWGQDYQANGYYPYWIYPDPERPGRSVFAFNPQPEDVVDDGGRDEKVELGERSTRVVQRWVPVLQRLRQTEVQ
ncbi:MAG TPA: hypothetical protein VNT01_12620 [Symbiobacteriaceae bacterium]|nr:hypothetical protein [Symbiobacteriaceae bacterium]